MLTGFGMDTEGTLQQMVHPFTDVDVEPRVTILQHDLFLKVEALFGSALGEGRSCHHEASRCNIIFFKINSGLNNCRHVMQTEPRTRFLMA